MLFENELALDVGGVCWGYSGEEQSIIDHHFYRAAQFPSASAAVLHNARRIWHKFSQSAADVIWFITHHQSDFDAFCSMYIARSILEDASAPIDWDRLGVHEEGWLDVPAKQPDGAPIRKINWFTPALQSIPPDQRWRVLLAANASCVDNSRRILCPKSRALHSVLYAAVERGRDYLRDDSGATEFFDHVKGAIQTNGLNPLYDSVLEHDPFFAPELAMLDREVEAYGRDIRRARKVIVHLQKMPSQFEDFFPHVKGTPLLNSDLIARQEHVAPTDHTRSLADGVYLRDPECLLFKEWARLDNENSSMGLGFLFTAVVYSNGRPGSEVNEADYFFAIDPEKASRRHLYGVWAQLQSAEVRALNLPEHQRIRRTLDREELWAASSLKRTNCRPGFQERAGPHRGLFDDPWFDGSNYGCTIVATPNRGTFIGAAGLRGDLLDDPVAIIVQRELESSIYSSITFIEDLPASRQTTKIKERSLEVVTTATVAPPPTGHFRLGHVQLHKDVNLVAGVMAGQIGCTLWHVLNPDMEGTPTDFFSRHLFINPDWLGIWSRRGMFIAHKESARDVVAVIEERFRELATLARDVDIFVNTDTDSALNLVETSEELTRRAAQLEHGLVLPENRILSRFFEAIRLGDALKTLREINVAAAERIRNEKLDRQTLEFSRHTATVASVQTKLEWLEVFFVGFYATELSRTLAELLGLTHEIALIVVVIVGITFTTAAALVLAPWQNGGSKRLSLILLLLGLLWLGGLLARWYLPLNLLDTTRSGQS